MWLININFTLKKKLFIHKELFLAPHSMVVGNMAMAHHKVQATNLIFLFEKQFYGNAYVVEAAAAAVIFNGK